MKIFFTAEYNEEELKPLYEIGEKLSFPLLFEAAQNGDRRARELTDHLARCYGDALHNVAVVYNPDQVIFQGLLMGSTIQG